jgi:arylsulfatase A-like enzyme
MRSSRKSFALGFALFQAAALLAAPAADHRVILIVWDGMRPDFVSEQNTPTLWNLARRGVTFAHHHAVYISATEVNGTALSTGSYPMTDGIVGNSEYRPEIDPLKAIHTEIPAAVRKGDELTRGNYLLRPTLAEIVRASGRQALVAGAKPVALLHDRAPRDNDRNGINLVAGTTLPADLAATLTNRHGPFPKEGLDKPTRNDWTTEALIHSLWGAQLPDFSLVWMNEPDSTQHRTGPGSAQSLAAMRNSDENLARILKTLEARNALTNTDLLVVSDHGCSTISSRVNLVDDLNAAGFKATREFKTKPAPDEILVASNSGSTFVYVIGRDEKTIGRVVQFLQRWDASGVIFTRKPLPGTFTLKQVHLDSPGAPDIVVSLRWTAEKNAAGVSGMVRPDLTGFGVGQGIHVSLSPFDMRNTLIAAGPHFRAGITSTLPSGNVDVAPTILWLLGIKPAKPMDGRVLTEALTIAGPELKSYQPRRLEAEVQLEGILWQQYLNVSEVNGVEYFDEGNGSQQRAP